MANLVELIGLGLLTPRDRVLAGFSFNLKRK